MTEQIVGGRLLDRQAATGDGNTIKHLGNIVLPGWVQLEINGAPTRVVVSIKGLIDGSTFDTLLVLDTDEGYVSGEIVVFSWPIGVRDIKASLDTLTGGANPSVSCYFAGRG